MTEAHAPRRRLAGWPGTLLLVGAMCGLGILVALSSFGQEGNSDNFVAALAGSFYWTPFFWEQSRFGMLLAGLTVWIADPWINLGVQTAVNVACGFGALYLAARWALPRSHARLVFWPAAFLMCSMPDGWMQNYWLIQTPYAVSLCLGLGALLLSREFPPCGSVFRWPVLAASTLLLVLAFWVNLGLAPLAFFLVLTAILLERRTDALSLLIPPTAAFLVNLLFWQGSCYPKSIGRFMSPWDAWHNLGQFGVTVWQDMAFNRFWGSNAALVACLALGGAGWAILRGDRTRTLRAVFLWVLPALGFIIFVSFLYWPKINDYNPRYLVPSIVLLTVAAAATVIHALPPRARSPFAVLCMVATLTVVVLRCDPLTPAGARSEFDRRWGSQTALLTEWRPTFIVGDYWKAWAAFFHLLAEQHRTGNQWDCFAISERSKVTLELWQGYLDAPEATFAAWADDPDLNKRLAPYGRVAGDVLATREGMVLYRLESPQAAVAPR